MESLLHFFCQWGIHWDWRLFWTNFGMSWGFLNVTKTTLRLFEGGLGVESSVVCRVGEGFLHWVKNYKFASHLTGIYWVTQWETSLLKKKYDIFWLILFSKSLRRSIFMFHTFAQSFWFIESLIIYSIRLYICGIFEMFVMRLAQPKAMISNLHMLIENMRDLEHKKYMVQNQVQFLSHSKQAPSKFLEKNEVSFMPLRLKQGFLNFCTRAIWWISMTSTSLRIFGSSTI